MLKREFLLESLCMSFHGNLSDRVTSALKHLSHAFTHEFKEKRKIVLIKFEFYFAWKSNGKVLLFFVCKALLLIRAKKKNEKPKTLFFSHFGVSDFPWSSIFSFLYVKVINFSQKHAKLFFFSCETPLLRSLKNEGEWKQNLC